MFLIYCIDRPDSEQLRANVRPEHLDYLSGFKDKIAVGGPLLDQDDKPKGTVLIMNFDNKKTADDFVKNEPYNRNGLFETLVVRRWRGVSGSWLPAN